jgi:hypothetical protein
MTKTIETYTSTHAFMEVVLYNNRDKFDYYRSKRHNCLHCYTKSFTNGVR